MSPDVTAGLTHTASAAPWFAAGVLTALLPQILSAAWSWWRTRHWDTVARDACHRDTALRRWRRHEW